MFWFLIAALAIVIPAILHTALAFFGIIVIPVYLLYMLEAIVFAVAAVMFDDHECGCPECNKYFCGAVVAVFMMAIAYVVVVLL